MTATVVIPLWRAASIAMGCCVLVAAVEFARSIPSYRVLLALSLAGYRAAGLYAQIHALSQGTGFSYRLVLYPILDALALAALLIAIRGQRT